MEWEFAFLECRILAKTPMRRAYEAKWDVFPCHPWKRCISWGSERGQPMVLSRHRAMRPCLNISLLTHAYNVLNKTSK
jgi:hypothetical protein